MKSLVRNSIVWGLLAAMIFSASAAGKRTRRAAKAPKEPVVSFWADSRDDLYHLSTCTVPAATGAGLVGGSEADLIRLGYYPDPACLPNRSVARRAGRVVRVDGSLLLSTKVGGGEVENPLGTLPETPKLSIGGDSGGFPGLAPGSPPPKPAEAKPGDVKPSDPKPDPPAKPNPPAPGGFPGTPPGGTIGRGNANPPAATGPDFAFFKATVNVVMRETCSTCHGNASSPASAKFPIAQGQTEQQMQSNFQQAVSRIRFKNPAQSLLVRKPLNLERHGGGVQLRQGSSDLKAFVDWINGAK